MTEQLDVDAVGTMRVLVERKYDDVTGFESLDDVVERAALAHDAEAGAIEAARHERVQPARLDRPPHEMKPAVHLGIILYAGDRRDLPIAEVAGQDQDAFAFAEGSDERIEVLDANDRALAFRRQPTELQKFNGQFREMPVVRLCETVDLRRRNSIAEHAPHVVEHDAPAKRQRVKADPAEQGD